MLLVAFLTEFSRRLVLDRTVRPDRVVFPPEPARLGSSVRHALELHSLQELVSQPTVKRLDVTVLPRASRLHGNRFGTDLLPPVRQGLADELRPVVAANPRRRPAAADHPSHDPSHVGPGHRPGRMEHQALPSVFVHHRQPLERTSSGGSVMNEIACPNIVLESRRLLGATVAPDAEL